MKILYLSSLYYPQTVGGAEKIAQRLAEEMAAKGNNVTVATLCQRADARTEWISGVRVIYAPIKNVYQPALKEQPRALRMVWHLVDAFNPLAAREVGRIIDEQAPDLMHTHNIAGFSAAVWAQARRRGVPCVHTIHDYYLLCSKSTLFRRGRNCRRMCASCFLLSLPRRKEVGCLSAAVAVSRAVLERHREVLKSVAIRKVIHNALAGAKDDFRDEAGRSGPIRLGYLGRLNEAKGLQLLLSEFQSFSENSDCELMIGGAGEDQYVRQLMGRFQSSRVSFLGLVDSTMFMKRINLLVVPSLWNDPFPTVVLEALAQGVAVVGARRGGIPELIRDGENGIVFEPTIRGDLRRALNEAIAIGLTRGESRSRIAESERHHTLARMCEQYEEVYREVQDQACNRMTVSRTQLGSYPLDSDA